MPLPRIELRFISGSKIRTGILLGICMLMLTMFASPLASTHPAKAFQTQCAGVLQLAMKNLSDKCNNLDADQVCYGNQLLVPTFKDPTSTAAFANVGDTIEIDSISSLTAAALNPDTNTWGLAVFRLNTDVPGATAGQAVTFIMYGDTRLDTAIPPTASAPTEVPTPISCTATTRRSIFLRQTADPNGQQVQLLPANTTLDAIGREPDAADWVQVQYQDKVGFIFVGNNNATLTCELSQLPDLGPAALPLTGPGAGTMYFTTNVGSEARCQDVSSSGLIVKSPEGQRVRFHLNGADLTIGSTVLIEVQPQSAMTVNVIEGRVWVRSMGFDEIAQTGQFISVPLGAAPGPITLPTEGPTPIAQGPTPAAVGAAEPIIADFSDVTVSGPPSKPALIANTIDNRRDQTTVCSLLSAAGDPCQP